MTKLVCENAVFCLHAIVRDNQDFPKLIDCENCCDSEIKMRYKAEVLKNVNTEKKMTQKQLFANSLKPISKKTNMNIICDEVKTYAPAYASGIKGDLTMLHYDPKIRFRMFNISTAHQII